MLNSIKESRVRVIQALDVVDEYKSVCLCCRVQTVHMRPVHLYKMASYLTSQVSV